MVSFCPSFKELHHSANSFNSYKEHYYDISSLYTQNLQKVHFTLINIQTFISILQQSAVAKQGTSRIGH